MHKQSEGLMATALMCTAQGAPSTTTSPRAKVQAAAKAAAAESLGAAKAQVAETSEIRC
jgi:hypothetical protein